MDIFILVMNIFLYFLFFCVYKRRKGIDPGLLIWGIYFMLSIFATFLYAASINQETQIKLLPFAYLIFAIYLSLRPIEKFQFSCLSNIELPNIKALNAYLYFSIFITCISLPGLVSSLVSNINSILFNISYFSEEYMDNSMNRTYGLDSGKIHILPIISLLINKMAIFFLYYYLTLKKKNKLILTGLIIQVVSLPLQEIISARRGGIVSTVLMMILAYAFFQKGYSTELNRKIRRFIVVILSVCVSFLALITLSRFGEKSTYSSYIGTSKIKSSAVYSVVNYVGQPMLNFNQYVLENEEFRNGDRAIALFKRIIYPDGAYTYDARMEKYGMLKVGENVFSTFIGDLVVDFGPFLTIIILFLVSFFLNRTIRVNRNPVHFYKLIPIYVLIYWIATGWTLNLLADVAGNLFIIYTILLYYYFKVTKFLKI